MPFCPKTPNLNPQLKPKSPTQNPLWDPTPEPAMVPHSQGWAQIGLG